MSAVNAVNAASSAAGRLREHRRLPRSAAAGSQTVGSPFLWLLSFGDAKESDSPAGANSRLRLHQRTATIQKPSALTPTLSRSERE
ncbi:hypothetical protein EJI01_09555 [Variovorax sp. MHTC-1]|nr:hypothetical protein EJI01_09555 [Variovorax sp. MHTC-1]